MRLHEPVLPVLGPERPLELVRSGLLPALDELRLHQGTVWRWNRAIYDLTAGGHLRVELRALPAGPTVVDMLANADFALGLTLALAPEQVRTLPAGELVLRLLPVARQGLEDAGVAAEEAGRLLEVIGARVATGQTGAVWQRRALAALEGGALATMLERYLELQRTGDPVHTWPLAAA